jgi:CheY-like chemotaxis protein
MDRQTGETERIQYAEIIHRTAGDLSQVVNDILDLSKVEAGRVELNKVSVHLEDFQRDFERVMRVRCSDRTVELVFSRCPPLPTYIYTDPLRLRQILTNLVGNAIKFTEHGEVRLSVSALGDRLVFTIQDTGIGLSKQAAMGLFRPFTQVDSSSVRKYAGSGLGLVLARRLARLMGGDVHLQESEPGKGSTFVASVLLEEAEAVTPAIADTSPPAELRRLVGRNILVVEDALENQILIERFLTREGATVTLANNGHEGVEMALKGAFDVVVMDVQMPVMDGYTAARKLRAVGYPGPVIALTAHAMKEDRERCLVAGYSEYLSKPINRDELIRVLARST